MDNELESIDQSLYCYLFLKDAFDVINTASSSMVSQPFSAQDLMRHSTAASLEKPAGIFGLVGALHKLVSPPQQKV